MTADARQKSPFAPIRVAAGAFEDPRLRTAARLLRLSFEKVFVGLQRFWSWVTAEQLATVHPMTIAEFLGRPRCADTLADAFCHPAVDLAELHGDGSLSLHLHDLFGDIDWYAQFRASAPAGGNARAARATRNDDGTFAPRDIEAEVMAILAQGPLRRCDIRGQLRCRKQTVSTAVKALLASRAIVERKGGYLSLSNHAEEAAHESAAEFPSGSAGGLSGSAGSAEPVPRPAERSAGTHGPTAEPSAPTPVPAPAPGGESAPARACLRAIPTAELEVGPGGPIALPDLVPLSPSSSDVPAGRSSAPPLATLERIAARYEELGQELEPDWRPQSTVHRIRQVTEVWNCQDEIPEMAVLHALEMLAAEARERKKLRLADPTRWYRAAWSPRVFQRALDIPNEKAAHQAAHTAQAREPRGQPQRATLAEKLARRRLAGAHS